MAASVLVDAGFVVALLSRRDIHHPWAPAQSASLGGGSALQALLRRAALRPAFDLGDQLEPVLKLMQKYADVPMSLADACLVRMSETLSDSLVLTTDTDFRVYRRHSRQVVPCLMPD